MNAERLWQDGRDVGQLLDASVEEPGLHQVEVDVEWAGQDGVGSGGAGLAGVGREQFSQGLIQSTTDQAATEYDCSATSEGGSAAQQSVTIKRDGTALVVAYDGVT